MYFYQLDTWSKNLNTDFTLGDCLFGGVKLTKNVDLDKYGYSGDITGFDSRSDFSINGEFGKNVVLFGEDNGSSVHVDIKEKDILVLGEDPNKD